ncbi:MAG: hypothetical protein R2932_53440 [Caldilineaceae bacterium]
MMRIASLLPSATEIVCALGLAECLVGVSHECDYPAAAVAELPILTRSVIPVGLSSAAVDALVSDLVRRGQSLYAVEEERLAMLNPDLLITQELCDVCAVAYDDVCQRSQRLLRPSTGCFADPTRSQWDFCRYYDNCRCDWS